MRTLQERLKQCDLEIAQAIEDGCKPHTAAEHVGILLWETDWRAEREAILASCCLKGQTKEHPKPPRLEDEGQPGG